MIKANELRIGNWVMGASRLEPIQVTASMLYQFDKMNIHPIPLTPEILEKCGFEKYVTINEHKKIDVLEGYVNIKFMFNTLPIVLDIDSNRMPLHHIKYLHQLQNLYFALTGEELTVNL